MLNEYEHNNEYNENQELQQPEIPTVDTTVVPEAPKAQSKKRKNGKRVGLVAGILSGALVLSAAGGYGGSALYNMMNQTQAPAVAAQEQTPGERPEGQAPDFGAQEGQGERPARPDGNTAPDQNEEAPDNGEGQFPFGMFEQKDNEASEQDEAPAAKSDASTDTEDSTTKASLTLSTKSNGQSLTTQEIASYTADAVVEITTESVQTGDFMQQYVASGAGSGVIVSEDGYIITNNHVIEGATQITVTTTDGTAYEAKLVGRDDNLDVALLKVDATDLTVASFGDSDQLQLGEKVVAIGNPLGQLGGTVTEGIISALDREITIDGKAMTLLQTDASINPGNSGGGLFNDQGQLIGLVVAKSAGEDVEGLGFAIPINDVQAILNDLLNYGYTKGKAYLGISLLDITSEQMARMYNVSETGTYVYSVEDDSAAAEAGLKSGDRIISVDGQEITSNEDVRNLVSSSKVGDELSFVIQRGLSEETLTVTVGEYVPEAMPAVSE